MLRKPRELERAELIDGLAQRWGCPPSVVLNEPARVLQMVALIQLGRKGDDAAGE